MLLIICQILGTRGKNATTTTATATTTRPMKTVVLPSYCVPAGPTSTRAPVFSVVVIGHLVGVLTGPITWDPFDLLAAVAPRRCRTHVLRPATNRNIAEGGAKKTGERL